LGLRRQAQPFLEELAEQTHETVNLAILDGKHVLYIDKIESPETIKVDLNIGKRLPSYCTGLGKAMLAQMSEKKVKQLFKEETLTAYTPNTITSIEDLLAELSKIKRQGYSIDNEEYVKGLVCIAAPVKDYRGETVAAMSIAIPEYRYKTAKHNIDYIYLVKKAACGFSRQLGYKG